MSSRTVTLHGKVPSLKESDAKRLAVYVLQGGKVLAKSAMQPDGGFRVALSRAAITAPSVYAFTLAIAPAGLGEQVRQLPNLPQVTLHREQLEKVKDEHLVSTERLRISDALLATWWLWCFPYCVSGTVIGPHGCPVPGAAVTVYSVSSTGSGYTKVPEVTVTTGPDGTFTACFEWCSCPFFFCCWPCWPLWWDCWPWWWENDILHIIEAIEQQPPIPGPGPVESLTARLNLIRPEGRALVRGQGFPEARVGAFAPDTTRTALLKTKLSQAAIRAVFPYWWWCCDDPNILFSVSQGGNVILNEDPATDTRWCFEDGSTVALIGNAQAIEACPTPPPIDKGFAWTRVGYVTVDHIVQGYTDWWGGDSTDAAFAGTLDIYGGVAPGTPLAYYQVEAGQWTGDPARGGSPPSSASPISASLWNYAFIYDSGGNLVFSNWIQMGPFTQGSLVNLYATETARQSGPTPPGLAAFPPIPAGGFVLWAYVDRKVYADSSALIGGAPSGSVDLTLVGYDSGFNPITLTPDDPLTLTIDNTPLTTARVNSVKAFCQGGSPAPLSGTTDCPTYTPGTLGYVQIDVTVSDASGHLGGYYVDAEYGHGNAAAVTPPGVRGYTSNPLVCSGSDPNYAQKSWVGCEEVITFPGNTLGGATPPDCCYEFRIRAFKRVTDGYGAPAFGDYDFQTVGLTFSVSTPTCP